MYIDLYYIYYRNVLHVKVFNMLIDDIQVEQNTVRRRKKNVEHFVGEKTIFSLEINLDEKKAILIEISEDAFGDEVYYNYLKLNRKLIDETDLDEERV